MLAKLLLVVLPTGFHAMRLTPCLRPDDDLFHLLLSFKTTDHTIANLFRMQLLRDPSVRFAGYYHPHPLVHFINMKIQTNNSNVAPVEVLSSAIEDLSNETDHLITQFQEAIEAWKREHDADMAQF